MRFHKVPNNALSAEPVTQLLEHHRQERLLFTGNVLSVSESHLCILRIPPKAQFRWMAFLRLHGITDFVSRRLDEFVRLILQFMVHV